LVKLILRDKEYEVKPGMTLLSALQKINVVPESVIATRESEMILEDEILKDGDVVKLIAVISGGAEADIRESNPVPAPRLTNFEFRGASHEM
jgi:sulfur carrier protein ThiS